MPGTWIATGQRVLRELMRTPARGEQPLEAHRDAALRWLCRAQDVNPDGGVAASYHLKDGWLPSYPETTGYIARTFFDHACVNGDEALRSRAWRMIDWLLERQFHDGGFPGQFGDRSAGPIVFNTGQILFGLVRAAQDDPQRGDVQHAARNAAGWLIAKQGPDGCWRRNTHAGVAHAYNSRTAWALLCFADQFGAEEARQAALRNLGWVRSRQRDSGWIEDAGFWEYAPPYLHTIAYAVRGLLECGLHLNDPAMIEAAERPAAQLLNRFQVREQLAGAYHTDWREAGSYRCLTGELQTAIIWMRLHQHTARGAYLAAAQRLLRQVAKTQHLDGPDEICGAIAGSYPLWGAYSRFEYPNWAAKFLVDAVDLYEALTRGDVGAKGGG
ncbi:MAG: hypothetical protein D6744_13245 [Planctomycetota bacterium]|nr:MAG: hypothetical protein D6744_13245 [Planctomycetota bacterium]